MEDENPQAKSVSNAETQRSDDHFLSFNAYKEYEELSEFVDWYDYEEIKANNVDSEESFQDWPQRVRNGMQLLPASSPEVEDASRSYTFHPLTFTPDLERLKSRTYRVNLKLDDDFGSLKDRIITCTRRGIQRIVNDQTKCFVRNAKEHGLSWRRPKGNFPHPLPYYSPPPDTNLERYREEAGVIAAAFHFPLTQPSPGIEMLVYRKNWAPNGNRWITGSADVNHYNDDRRHFHINLNGRAFIETDFSDEFWSGVIVHEMLHNLGWSHPDGKYKTHMAIENYQACIEGGHSIVTVSGAVAIR